MYITKIDSNSTNKNNLYFKSKLSEKEIIQGVDKIIYKGNSFIEENLGYFIEMRKGSNIEPNRKAQIDKWITEKLATATAFNAKKQEQITRNEINFLEQQETPNILLRNLKKVLNFASNLINNETPPTHPLERKFNSQKEEMNFFRDFKDLFTSYLELRPKTNSKASSIKAEKPLELQDILQQYGLEKYGLDMHQSKTEEVIQTTADSFHHTNESQQTVKPNKTSQSTNSIRRQFEEYEQRRMNSKPRTQMTTEEIEEDCRWYREEYFPLLEKIKQQNISTIPHKIFSDNPLEQVKEKHDFIEYALCRMNDSEASFYDALLAFEKYGKREQFQQSGINTLTEIAINFQHNSNSKIINKIMDLFEKFGKFNLDDDGFEDGLTYLTFLEKDGVITNQAQLQRALQKGKNIIWNDRLIDELQSSLTRGENAPLQNNAQIENIFQQFKQTAFNNRTPFKDDFNITSYEKSWGIIRV